MEALREFTYRELRAGIDGDFIHADQHMRELKRGTRYKGTKGTTVTFETFSSEFDKNNVIWTQSIKLMDLKDALKMTDLKLSDRVKLAMAGDIGVRCDCLTGDVRVPLLDGTSPTMLELLARYGVDKEFWVYSVDGNGDFVPGRAKCLGERKRVRSTVRVTLDNDESFECTKEHPVMRRDGSYTLAADLRVGDSLMPIYREMDGEYENYLINSEQRWERTYQRVASTVNREQLRETWGPSPAPARMREIWAERKAVANHKVKSVVFVEHDVPVPVYDITVEGSHNFLIAPGVVVHNCPAFQYWGYAWILTQLDAINPPPEDRKPNIRNPGSRGTVCKHLALVFSVFGNHWNSVTKDLKAQGLV